MKKFMTLMTATVSLAACQNADNGADETTQMADADGAETASEPILADRSLEGVDKVGTDIVRDADATAERDAMIKMPAKARYATYYLGSYAPKGQCVGADQFLELDDKSITFGETKCSIDALTGEGSAIAIKATQCMAEGEKAADRSYQLDIDNMGAITVAGAQNAALTRCGSATTG